MRHQGKSRDGEALMGLVPAERTHCDRAHAIKKRASSRDARKTRAILSYNQDVGIVRMFLENSLRGSGPRRQSGRAAAARVFFDTRKPTRLICGSCKSCGKAR